MISNLNLNLSLPMESLKLAVENLLESLSEILKSSKIICLRYFNPGGNHHSGKIGDNPSYHPSNIFSVIQ